MNHPLLIEQIVNEIANDMVAISAIAKPLSEKWKRRKEDLKRVEREATPPMIEKLRVAARTLSEALDRFPVD
jgi:hypothetical protein